jgi:hypothetical protein
VAVPPHRVRQQAATSLDRTFSNRPVRQAGLGRILGHEHAPLRGETRHRRGIHEVPARGIAECRLHRGTETRIDDEVLVEPPPTDPSRCPRDPAGLLLGLPRLEPFQPAAQLGQPAGCPDQPFGSCPGGAFGGIGGSLGRGPVRRRLLLGRNRLRQRRPGRRGGFLQRVPPLGRLRDQHPFVARTPLGVGQPSPGRLQFRLSNRLCATNRCTLLASCLARGPQGGQFRKCIREGALRSAELPVQRHVPRRHRRGERTPLDDHVGFDDRMLLGQATAFPADRVEVCRKALLAQPQRGQRRLRRLEGRPSLTLHDRPRTQLVGQSRCCLLGRLQLGHRGVGLGLRAFPPRIRRSGPRARLEPPRMRGQQQPGGELLPGRQPRGRRS